MKLYGGIWVGKNDCEKNHPYQIYCIFLLKLTNFMKFMGEEKPPVQHHYARIKKPLKKKQQKLTER